MAPHNQPTVLGASLKSKHAGASKQQKDCTLIIRFAQHLVISGFCHGLQPYPIASIGMGNLLFQTTH
eukprot:1153195-Pelagomonas_calceolata.AAC.5